ncbi:F0F1-ATPase subunit family protein [Burkholderia pseudomallei MSHR511]|nr:F0F1-ATPase subunit family protein [Burkholderia pseudomallei MSHR511]
MPRAATRGTPAPAPRRMTHAAPRGATVAGSRAARRRNASGRASRRARAPKPAADRVERPRHAARAARGARDPEPSLGRRLAQIGVLGWTIVAPTLAALALGRWLDRMFATRVFFSAPLLMLGAALGLWLAWRWMKAQQHGDRDD